MDSFGRPQKYASNRKQELQLQNELKAIKDKAYYDRHVKLHTLEATSSSVLERDIQSVRSPKPPSKPKPHSSTNWKRVRLNQHTPPSEMSSTEDHHVPAGLARKPVTSKRVTKTSKRTTTEGIVPSQKLLFDTSAQVKFAITSSLNTSVPVRHTQRSNRKIVGKYHTVSKERPSESEHPEGLGVSSLNNSMKEQTNYHPHYSQVDDSAADSSFTTGPNRVESIVSSDHFTDKHIGETSPKSSSADTSFVSQDKFHSSFVGSETLSEVDSRFADAENQDTEPILFDSSEPQTNTRVPHSSTGSFMLEVDMCFKANQTSEHSRLFPDRFEVIEDTFKSSCHSVISGQSLSPGTTTGQSTADLEPQEKSTGDLSEVEGHSNLCLSLSSVASGRCSFGNSEVSVEQGTSQLQTDSQPRTPFESQQPSFVLSETDHLKDSSTSTITSVHDRASLQDYNVQSKEKVSEVDQSSSTPLSSYRSPTLDLWPIGFEPLQPLKSGLDSDNGSSSTFKGSDNKDSMFFSIGGSLSSFEIPFSLQSHSNSLTDTCSRELTTSTDSRTSNISPLPNTTSSLSNVNRVKSAYSKPNVEQYLLSSSDQHLAMSSWLKTVGSDVHFSCDSDPFSGTEYNLEADEHQDTQATDLKNSSDVSSSSSSTSIAGYSTQSFDEVSKTDTHREIPRDQFFDNSIVDPDSASEQALLEANKTQLVNSENDNLDKPGAAIAKEVAKRENVQCTAAVDVALGTGGHTDSEEGVSLQGSLSEFLAYSKLPVTLEDVLHIAGQKLPASQRPPASHKSPLALSLESSAHPKKLHGVTDGDYESTAKPTLTFLSTWDLNPHPNIHHFCTSALSPQLPLPLQVLSYHTHAKEPNIVLPSSDEAPGEKQTEESYKDTSLLPRPHTVRFSNVPVARKRVDFKVTPKPKKPSSARSAPSRQPQVSSSLKAVDDNEDIVTVAQRRLHREMMGSSNSKDIDAVLKPTKTKRSSLLDIKVTSMTDNQNEVRVIDSKESVSENEGLMVTGARIQVVKNHANLLWNPAPPKLSLHPSTIQAHLFPQYRAAVPGSATRGTGDSASFIKTSQVAGGQEEKIEETLYKKQRLLDGAFRSVPNFSSLLPQITTQSIQQGGSLHTSTPGEPSDNETPSIANTLENEQSVVISGEDQSANDKREPSAYSIDGRRFSVDVEAKSNRSDKQLHVAGKNQTVQSGGDGKAPGLTDNGGALRHSQSLPQISYISEESSVPCSAASKEFSMLMKEVESQKEQLVEYHEELRAPKEDNELTATSDLDESNSSNEQILHDSMCAINGAFTSRKLQRQIMKGTRRGTKVDRMSERVRAIRRTKSAQLRAEKVKEVLSQPPWILKRRGSHPFLKDELPKITEQPVNKNYRLSRYKSLPSLTERHFSALMVSQGTNPMHDSYKWALDLWWNTWFPEVLKECRQAVVEFYPGYAVASIRPTSDQSKPNESKSKEVLEIDWDSTVLEFENIESKQELNSEMANTYEKEVSSLTETIGAGGHPEILAAHYCRRGAVLRKLGRLKEAMSDVDQAILLQPSLSDAYWHRHLLFLIQGNDKAAMDDLSQLLKYNKKHLGVFWSRAKLLCKRDNLSSALYNMTQAIALQPNDPGAYFLRAEIYQKRGEVESALTDYTRVSELDPGNIEALRRMADHKFNKGMWTVSVQLYSTLLLYDPNNSEIRIRRARANYKLDRYLEALQDLSAVIHLNPNGSQAFYHRACLLRKTLPEQALKDFSVSLLLDNSVANINSLLHRGVIYTQLNSYDEALSDFESAARLQRSLTSPHICAGLIHMLHKRNITQAICCFSTAIFVEPTCTRAYVCRAEAYQRYGEYKLAIQDYTKLIHMEPNNFTYYINKGKLFLYTRELELAYLHIKIAAKLCTEFGNDNCQRALIESFIGNYSQAITLLQEMPKTPDIYTLLGKIQFKAKDFGSSANSFKQGLHLVEQARKPSCPVTRKTFRGDIDPKPKPKTVNQKTKIQLHLLCGKSLVEFGSLQEAIEEFTAVIRITPNHEVAYYERGLAKLMDGNKKGILDLNKSLLINPRLFQPYLARAAYFGHTGRLSKAILNCNEAIRLEPACVRAYLCRGALKYHIKLYNGAITDFSAAILLDPKHASLGHFNRAICYQTMGKLQMALSDYSTVFSLMESPGFKMLVNRALLYLELEDWSSGLFDFITAAKLVKDDPAIFQAMGYCYHRLGDIDSSIEAYSEAINHDPSFLGAYIGRGNAYMDYLTEDGNRKSKQDYLHTLKLDPSYFPARVNIAFLLQAEGKFQQAWNELTLVLQKDEWYISAREARSIISLQMGNLFGALIDINAAIQVSRSALLLTNRGVIHQFMGDVVSAMNDYQEAVRIDPHYSLAYFNIGNILFEQRHFRQAMDSYTEALADTECDDSFFVNRAIARVMLRDTELALEDFHKAIQINPYSAHAYFNRGNLYRSLGDYGKAKQDYILALDLQPEDWLTMYCCGEVMAKLNRQESAHRMLTGAAETEIMTNS